MQFLFPVMTPEAVSGASPLSTWPQSLGKEKTNFERAHLRISENIKMRDQLQWVKGLLLIAPTPVKSGCQWRSEVSEHVCVWFQLWSVPQMFINRILNLSKTGVLSLHFLYRLFLQTCPVSSWFLANFLHLQHPREGISTAEYFCLYLENPRRNVH